MGADTVQSSIAGTGWLDKHGLRPRHRLFVLFYLETHNATESARKVGYQKPKQQGSRMLSNVAVYAAIKEGQARIEERTMLNIEGIVMMWAQIAMADVAELIKVQVGACRYCWGVDHEFQWTTEREYQEARIHIVYDLFTDDAQRVAALQGEVYDPRIPTNAGGYGYRSSEGPYPDCPECSGLGIERVQMADTSTLTDGAKLLFNGVEKTQQGKKIKILDRAKALENLAKHFGMFDGKVERPERHPITGLLNRIMGNASSAPIRPDNP